MATTRASENSSVKLRGSCLPFDIDIVRSCVGMPIPTQEFALSCVLVVSLTQMILVNQDVTSSVEAAIHATASTVSFQDKSGQAGIPSNRRIGTVEGCTVFVLQSTLLARSSTLIWLEGGQYLLFGRRHEVTGGDASYRSPYGSQDFVCHRAPLPTVRHARLGSNIMRI